MDNNFYNEQINQMDIIDLGDMSQKRKRTSQDYNPTTKKRRVQTSVNEPLTNALVGINGMNEDMNGRLINEGQMMHQMGHEGGQYQDLSNQMMVNDGMMRYQDMNMREEEGMMHQIGFQGMMNGGFQFNGMQQIAGGYDVSPFQMPQMMGMDGIPVPLIQQNAHPGYVNQMPFGVVGGTPIPIYGHLGHMDAYISSVDEKCNMEFILQTLNQKGLPQNPISFDALDRWLGDPEEESDLSDDEKERNDTSVLDAGEIDLRYYDVPPYKYICGGCGSDYLKSQSVAAHNRACEKYQHLKEKNSGILKNKKQDITDKWWADFLAKNPDKRQEYRRSGPLKAKVIKKKIKKRGGEKKILQEPESDYKRFQPVTTQEWESIFSNLINTLNIDVIGLTHSEDGKFIPHDLVPKFVGHLLRHLLVNRSDVFCDINFGIGSVVFQAYSEVGCKCAGLESSENLFRTAKSILDSMNLIMEQTPSPQESVTLLKGTLTTSDFDYFLSEATVIFWNNLRCLRPEQDLILEKFSHLLRDGCRIVTLQDLFNDMYSQETKIWKDHPIKDSLYAWESAQYDINEESHIQFFVYTYTKKKRIYEDMTQKPWATQYM